jgi:hypothetical protein
MRQASAISAIRSIAPDARLGTPALAAASTKSTKDEFAMPTSSGYALPSTAAASASSYRPSPSRRTADAQPADESHAPFPSVAVTAGRGGNELLELICPLLPRRNDKRRKRGRLAPDGCSSRWHSCFACASDTLVITVQPVAAAVGAYAPSESGDSQLTCAKDGGCFTKGVRPGRFGLFVYAAELH